MSCLIRIDECHEVTEKIRKNVCAFKTFSDKATSVLLFFWYVGCHRVVDGNGLKRMARDSGSKLPSEDNTSETSENDPGT